MIDDPYGAIAEFYDLEHADFADDLDLYLNLAQVVGDPILDLGCGSGRVLIPLAQAGFRVTGLDQSATMLARARQAIVEAGVESRVQLVQADMTASDQAPGGPFGMVIIALNGLLHLADAPAQRATLAAAYRALDPRGQLVLDLFDPSPESLRGFEHGVSHEGSWRLVDGTRVDKFSSRRVSPAMQRIDTEIWYDVVKRDGGVARTMTAFPLRYLQRSELELMLELTGFKEWQCYGSYQLDPYDDGAERLVVTAEITPSRVD